MESNNRIIANTVETEENRVAIVENGRLAELFHERMWERQRTGEIYKARVDSVIKGMHAAFLNLGDGRNAFLYLADAGKMKIKQNMEIIVQVVKSARKGKGARVTPRISLPGRYLVLVPGRRDIGVSRRITSGAERKRLRNLVKSLRSGKHGVIVRTVAEGVEDEPLQEDFQRLLTLWEEIKHNSETQPAPSLLYRDPGLLGKILRDELDEEVQEIVVDSSEEADRVREYVERYCHMKAPEIRVYSGSTPIFEFYGIDRELETALDRKFWLPSGAYLVIEQTEALTVIDVNTGKYIGSTDLRSTVLNTNLEAAEEIARQLRLRAVGGIVVIDFIDMEHEEDRERLLSRLREAFQHDRYRARVYGVSKLGLVEMTRKRARPDLKAALTRSCPFCAGHGWVLKEDSVALMIKRFLRKVARTNKAEALLLELHPDIARHIAENYHDSWEEELERKLFLVEVPEFAWDKFRLHDQGKHTQISHEVEKLLQKEAPPVVHSTDMS